MKLNKLKNVSLCAALVGLASCGTQPNQAPEEKTDEVTAEELVVSEAQSAQLQQEYSAMPQAVIVKVPVDAKGNELSTQSELRSYYGKGTSEASIASDWEKSQVSDELDEETSIQSYYTNDHNSNRSYHVLNNRGNRNNNRNYNHNNNRRGNRGNYGNTNNHHNNRHGNYRHNRNNHNHYYSSHPHRRGQRRSYRRGYRNGYRDGSYNNNYYYYNSYRPSWFSRILNYAYWSYNTYPTCYTNGGYRYYIYNRPTCNSYTWCNGVYY